MKLSYIFVDTIRKKMETPRNYTQAKGIVEGLKTKFIKDVKISIKAGMEFETKNYKIRTIGYEVFRLYYDTKEMDMQVGRQKIKRVINK
jgi:hypothetical protein